MGADLGFSIAAVILVLLAGGFAAIDTALLTVSRARVEDLVKEKRGGAYRLLRVVDRRATYVALVVLLRVASETTAAVLAAVVLTDTLGLAWGLVAAALVMTILSYIAAGVGPRTLGRQHAYSIGIFAAPLLTSIGVLLRPVTRLLILIGNALTPGRGFRNGPFATEVELREVVDLAEAQGVVDPDERRMIQSVFELGNTTAREVMVPRPEMVWIESDKTAGQAVSLAVRSGHSRVPVIGVNPDDIRGVLYLKDIVAKELEAPSALRDITVDQLMRPAEFIPDTKPLDAVLADMQKLRNHMALLVDEYGGIAGLVTIEDVIEEIVGEISDEYDVDEVAPIAELGNDRYRVSARLTVEELGALFDIDIDPDDIDDVETVGGLIALELGRVPLPGARVESNGLVLLAEGGPNRQGRQRIASVVAHRAVQPADEPPTERRSREKRAPEKKSAEKKNPEKKNAEKKNAEKKNADKKTAAKKTAEKRSTDQKAAESTARPEGAEA